MPDKDLNELADELQKISANSAKNMDGLVDMIKNPTKYFEDNPIKEDWQDPPKAPALKETKFIIEKGSTEQRTRLYAILSRVCHFQKRSSKEDPNAVHYLKREFQDELEELIAGSFRNKGWQIRGQKEMRDDSYRNIPDTMPHFDFNGICIHEIPKFEGTNTSVTDFIFDKDGEPLTYDKFLEKFRESHPVPERNFDELTKDLDEKQKKMIREFLDSENLEVDDIQSIEKRIFYEKELLAISIYSKEFEMMESEQIAEKVAFTIIDEDDEMKYFWKQKIESDEGYTGGLDEFIEDVKNDGWQYQLCRYDHEFTETDSGFVYWRTN